MCMSLATTCSKCVQRSIVSYNAATKSSTTIIRMGGRPVSVARHTM
nr:MAG TPA: hypothetical protein [Caudoviricetes sp.]